MVDFTDGSCFYRCELMWVGHILDTFCIGVDKYGLWSEQGFCRELKVPSCESPAAAVQDIKGHCNSYKNGPLFYRRDLFNGKICFQGYMNCNWNKGAWKERQPRDLVVGVGVGGTLSTVHGSSERNKDKSTKWCRFGREIINSLVLNEGMRVRFTSHPVLLL